jgi:hypothetical protein
LTKRKTRNKTTKTNDDDDEDDESCKENPVEKEGLRPQAAAAVTQQQREGKCRKEKRRCSGPSLNAQQLRKRKRNVRQPADSYNSL